MSLVLFLYKKTDSCYAVIGFNLMKSTEIYIIVLFYTRVPEKFDVTILAPRDLNLRNPPWKNLLLAGFTLQPFKWYIKWVLK